MFTFITGCIAGAVIVIVYGLNKIEDSDKHLILALEDKDKTIELMEEEMDAMREELFHLNQTIRDLRENPKGKEL